MKKNCNNCRHLSWEDGDINDPSGYVCQKREYYDSRQDKLEKNMQELIYREKAKKCCTLEQIEGGKQYCLDYNKNKVFAGDKVKYHSLMNRSDKPKIGMIKCIGDMNKDQVNVPYIIGHGVHDPKAMFKIFNQQGE